MAMLHHLTRSSEQCSKTVAQVARDLDLTRSALGLWVKRARARSDEGQDWAHDCRARRTQSLRCMTCVTTTSKTNAAIREKNDDRDDIR
jgi:transposase-like protein